MIRLDLYLTNFGYVKSRQKAKSLIEGGFVTVNSKTITKPSFVVDEQQNLDIEISDPCPYVSRGGLKLEKILDEYPISLVEKIAMDIGASTGGFTDCLLQHGIRTVYAIDSGTNQLDESLKNDSRVISIENYNARNITYDDIGVYFDVITVDVSFISQTYILPSAVRLLNDTGVYMSLIKPQFEVGRENIGKGGIVKNLEFRLAGVKRVVDCANENGFKCVYFSTSPIFGGDGNVEYLAVFSKSSTSTVDNNTIKNIVLKN